jgi:hypothetical protein
MAISVVLEDGGEEFKFLCKGILVTEGFCSVYQGREDCLFVGWMAMGILV